VKLTTATLSILGALALGACATTKLDMSTTAPVPDRRVGLRGGFTCPTPSTAAPATTPAPVCHEAIAAEASWNLKKLSNTPAESKFLHSTNSDLSFTGPYAIQGNYNGYQVWDISNPAKPTLKIGYYCPASQSDVSVYKNLLFVSGEGKSGRLDCRGEGVDD
jgi:hypothetical protein